MDGENARLMATSLRPKTAQPRRTHAHTCLPPSRGTYNSNDPYSEAETSLQQNGPSYNIQTPNTRRRTHADTEEDLWEILGQLERARDTIQAKLDAQIVTNVGKRPKPLIPNWITKYLLLITFLGQIITIGLVELIQKITDKTEKNSTVQDVELAGNVLFTTVEVAHLILVFFVSFKVAKQVMHRTVSGSLMAQSYLSTVMLFSGLYTCIYNFNPSHAWKSVVPNGRHLSLITVYHRMLYFSVSTATLCGTSEIEPIIWYTDILVAIQMLTSFVYFTSIMSIAILPKRRSQFDEPVGRVKSLTRKLRRWIFGTTRTSEVYTM